MESWGLIIVAALLAEAIWETLKLVWDKNKVNVNVIGALVIGVLIAVLAGVDVFAIVGLTLVYPIVGQILTGVLLSRGANFIHDLFNLVKDGGTSAGYKQVKMQGIKEPAVNTMNKQKK